MIGRLAGLFLIPRWFSQFMSPGTQLGRYRIIEHIAAGGMGEVYLAHDPHLDRLAKTGDIAEPPPEYCPLTSLPTGSPSAPDNVNSHSL